MKRILFALTLALALMVVPRAFADICVSTTDCTFTFDEHNSSFSDITSTGPYGTVELALSGSNINVTLAMQPDFVLIDTGFPGSFGYNDTLGDATPFTASNFNSTHYSDSANNGGIDTTGGSGSDLHFDGFGYFDDAAATNGPSAGSSNAISNLTFTLSRSGGFSSVQQLIEAPSGGGDGAPYFVADVFDKACGANGGTACTGLVGVSTLTSPVPEPSSYLALLGFAFVAMMFIARRKGTNTQPVQ